MTIESLCADKKCGEWHAKYDKVVEGGQTIYCSECGTSLLGDKPEVYIICHTCWLKGKR